MTAAPNPSGCPRVRVIIVSYNSASTLSRAVVALAGQSFADFEAVIVDNASTDGGAQSLTLPDARFKVLPLASNLGFAGGNNVAARESATDYIALLNPDAFPEPEWLANLVAAADSRPDFDMFGSTQIMANNLTMLDGTGDVYRFFGSAYRRGRGTTAKRPYPCGEVFGPCGAAAFYRTAAFQAVGGFDEAFFCYCEDLDLAFRMRLAGGRCWQVGEAVVLHVGSEMFGPNGNFVTYHVIRNLMWTFAKNMPAFLFWLFFPAHMAWLAQRLVRCHLAGQGKVARKAAADGFAGLPKIWQERRRRRTTWRASVLGIARQLR